MTYFLSVCLSVCLSVIRFHLILFPVLPFPSEGASSTKRPGKTASKSSFIQRTASESIIPLHYSSSIWHAKNGTSAAATAIRTTKSADTGPVSKDTFQEPRSSYDSTTSLENANEKTRVNSSVVSESMLSSKMITSQNRSQSDRYSMQSFPISEEGGHSDLGILQAEEPALISQEIVDHTPPVRFASDTPSLTSFLALKSDIGITRGASSVASSGLLAKISPSLAANTPRMSQSSRSIVHTFIKPSSSEPLVISTRITASADTKHIVSN